MPCMGTEQVNRSRQSALFIPFTPFTPSTPSTPSTPKDRIRSSKHSSSKDPSQPLTELQRGNPVTSQPSMCHQSSYLSLYSILFLLSLIWPLSHAKLLNKYRLGDSGEPTVEGDNEKPRQG